MSLDLTKPCQTVDGRPARLLAQDLKGDQPLVWAAELDGRETLYSTDLDGRWSPDRRNSPWDIINAPPPKRVFYLNVYPKHLGPHQCATREEADAVASGGRIACVRVEEGRFDA